MHTNPVEVYYRRFRKLGNSAKTAIRYARTEVAWLDHGGDTMGPDDRAEEDCLVRLITEPECDTYDDSYLECCGLSPNKVKREKKELWDRIDREGCWILVSQYRLSPDHPWEDADSVGMFVGDDWKNSGYDSDLKWSALEALDKANEQEARELANRPSYANVGAMAP